MLTIYCALYGEAQEIIHTFQLKKEIGQTHFQVFSDEEKSVRLVITGVGAIAAASAVAEISAVYPPGREGFLLNFGTCAAGSEVSAGEIFLCNKLTEECSGRTFYPDMIYRHPFREAEAVSCARVKTSAEIREAGERREKGETDRSVQLYDMESAAIYQAGSYSYGPHQMFFLKVVSDHGEADGSFQKKPVYDFRTRLTEILKDAAPESCAYMESLRNICLENEKTGAKQSALKKEAEADAAVLGEEMHCSTVMHRELQQLLWYWKLTRVDYHTIINEYRRQGYLPAKDKREGKKILDEIKGNLL